MSTENTFIQVHLIYCLFIPLLLPYIYLSSDRIVLCFLTGHSEHYKTWRPRQYFFSNVWKTIASHWKLKTNTAYKDWHFFISNKEDTTAVKKVLGSLDLIAMTQGIRFEPSIVLLKSTRGDHLCWLDTAVKKLIRLSTPPSPEPANIQSNGTLTNNWKVHTSKKPKKIHLKSGSKSFSKISNPKFDKVPKIGLRNFFNTSWT